MKSGKLPEDAQRRSALQQFHTKCAELPCDAGVAADAGRLVSPDGMRPGDAILVTKWIALEGTSRVARARLEQLCGRFPRYLMEEAAGFDRYLSVEKERAVAAENGAHALYEISEGGIFGALWKFAALAGTGLEVELKKIPIRQETVEICNFYDLNPYQLLSGGSLLIAAENGGQMLARLCEAGVAAAIIGRATDGNDRVILNGDGRRYLGKPAPDEISKVLVTVQP